MRLLDNAQGNYRFLTGIAPYSAGVVAMPGYEIVRVTLQTPVAYRPGFALIERYLAARQRPQQALCGVELRLPQPLSFGGFNDFNVGYQALLADWNLLLGENNPVARTNIAPAIDPPTEPCLYAFSYTIACNESTPPPTFIVAGAGDLDDQANLSLAAIVRPGETSAQALGEKAACVMAVMTARLTGLGMAWANVTAVDLYTTQPIHPVLRPVILAALATPPSTASIGTTAIRPSPIWPLRWICAAFVGNDE